MNFLQVDVFTDRAYQGNPLAVFPHAASLSAGQMQSIASEMNLSETTFVMECRKDSYSVRIFTPVEELPFAGHPTIGTAWVLSHLGEIEGKDVDQHSRAGSTPIHREGDVWWFTRGGTAQADLETADPDSSQRLDLAFGLPAGSVGLEAREMGRSGRLRPALSDAGVEQLMIPVKDSRALAACRPVPGLLEEFGWGGYVFTALGAGRLRARGFWPGAGISEDPATGSAAAALGLYLAERVGDVDVAIEQGVEMGRPSLIRMTAQPGSVRVGGRCVLVLRGELEAAP